jgi:hypothetical protein
MMAGRNISVTHVALGTVRVQNTIATLGQAAGTAAAMCVRLGETPRGIYQRHMKELQQTLLKDDLFIPDLKNEDEGDPCRTAAVSASSVSVTEVYRGKHGVVVDPVPMNVARIATCGFVPNGPEVDGAWVWLKSDNDVPTVIQVGALTQGDVDTASGHSEKVYAEMTVPPGSAGWLKVPIRVPVEYDPHHPSRYLRLWIEPVEGISWRHLTTLSIYNICGERGEDGEWKLVYNQNYGLSVAEPVDVMANCSPENVINGISRIRSPEVYEWVSDPAQALPQWLQLDFEKPAHINSVSVVFDTDLTNPGTCRGIKIPGVPYCVKDYAVDVFVDGDWMTVAKVADNFMRKRIHTFENTVVEKIRVTVTATNGDPSARITEVRAALD